MDSIDDIKARRAIRRHESPHEQTSNDVGLQHGVTKPVLLTNLVFVCGCIASIAIFAIGYNNSPHQRGSTRDADFWFSIQASIAQISGLIGSAFLSWNDGRVPRWRWLLPTGAAGVCALTAAPIYVVFPTEWASFSALTASMLQSFLILQQFLFTSRPKIHKKTQ